LARREKDGDVDEIAVDVKQRLLIQYYSVDLKLLMFYNHRGSLNDTAGTIH